MQSICSNTTFLSIKGYGDFVVLAGYLKKYASLIPHNVLLTPKLMDLSRILLPKSTNLFCLDFIEGVFAPYDIKRASIGRIFKESLLLREFVNRKCFDSNSILLDRPAFRNRFMFFGIRHQYLPITNNIYKSYDNFFQVCRDSEERCISKPSSVLLFPYGSSSERDLPCDLMMQIVRMSSLTETPCRIAVHKSHTYKIDQSLLPYVESFDSSVQLVDLIKSAGVLVSIDSVSIHIANYYNIDTYVLSSEWDYFIPPVVLQNKRLYRNSDMAKFFRDFENNLRSE